MRIFCALFLSLAVIGGHSVAQAAPVCQQVNNATKRLSLKNTPIPTDVVPTLTLEQGIAFMNDYFALWNKTGKIAAQTAPTAPVNPKDLAYLVAKLYTSDAAVIQKDIGMLEAPQMVVPIGPFVELFMNKQRGNVHIIDSYCVNGNKVTASGHYYAPQVGKQLNEERPKSKDVAINEPFNATYTISGGVVKAVALNFDFLHFDFFATKYGIRPVP